MNVNPAASGGPVWTPRTPAPSASVSDPRDTLVRSSSPPETTRQVWGKRLVFGGLGLAVLGMLSPLLAGVGPTGQMTMLAMFGTGALTAIAGAVMGDDGRGGGGDFDISNPAHPLNPANPANPASPLNPNNF
jgi:hypothetical protein